MTSKPALGTVPAAMFGKNAVCVEIVLFCIWETVWGNAGSEHNTEDSDKTENLSDFDLDDYSLIL